MLAEWSFIASSNWFSIGRSVGRPRTRWNVEYEQNTCAKPIKIMVWWWCWWVQYKWRLSHKNKDSGSLCWLWTECHISVQDYSSYIVISFLLEKRKLKNFKRYEKSAFFETVSLRKPSQRTKNRKGLQNKQDVIKLHYCILLLYIHITATCITISRGKAWLRVHSTVEHWWRTQDHKAYWKYFFYSTNWWDNSVESL